jgi:hypothetical protein
MDWRVKLRERLHIAVRPEWAAAVAEQLARGGPLAEEEFLRRLLQAFLFADLNHAGEQGLPPNVAVRPRTLVSGKPSPGAGPLACGSATACASAFPANNLRTLHTWP